MLKYSIAALALVASSTFAFADPNNWGAKVPSGSSGATMEHSSGGAMKESGALMKEDRSSASDARPNSSKETAASRSDEGKSKLDRQQAKGDEQNSKSDKRQAQDSDRGADNGDRADRNERMGADQSRDKSKANRSSTGASEGTEGKSGTKGSIANISTEQKTRLKSVFSGHLVAPARDINVAVSVGIVVPRSVHFYPVPEDVVTIVPDYRGYEYFMIDDSHVAIVDPDTLEVVDIIVVA